MAEKSVNKQSEEAQKRIEAVIIGYEQGYVSYHNVKMIRLKGRDINLLIMADFMPTLGEISYNGPLTLELVFPPEETQKSYIQHSCDILCQLEKLI